MTQKYNELISRYLGLVRLYSVVSELRLHTNKAVSTETAKYYNDMLYTWDDYAPFLKASLDSMMQVFYIELDGFIGAFWDKDQKHVQERKHDQGSLAAYLYDSRRATRKKTAIEAFEALLEQQANELEMIHDMRGKLAHFKKLNERSKALVPGGTETREIINKLADILFLLGYRPGNKPHYIEQDNDATASTQKVIDKLVSPNDKADDMRKTYTKARKEWFSK